MRQGTRLILNSVLTMSTRLVAVGTRLVIVPFAIGVLGAEHYGAWVVVGGLLAYAPLLEMGMRAAVTRQTALCLARGEQGEFKRYFDTATAYYGGVALLVGVATLIVCVFFPTWFDIQPRLHTPARIMVLCAGGATAAAISLYAYGAYIAGRQRYELDSGTSILVRLLQLALILIFLPRVGTGEGLILLAAVMGGTQLLGRVVLAGCAVRIAPGLSYRPWRADRKRCWELVSFGVNSSLYSLAALGTAQVTLAIVGGVISTSAATDFRVALEPIIGVHAFVIACTVILRPAASRYQGLDNERMLRELLLRASRYAGVVAFAGMWGLALFVDAFLNLWQGANYAGADGAAALVQVGDTTHVLLIGFAFFWLMAPAFSVLDGAGHNRVPARLAVIAAGVGLSLVITLALRPGATIERVAWGLVLPMVPIWAVILPCYCCRKVGQPIRQYLLKGLGLPLLGTLPAGLVSLVLSVYFPVSSWAGLLLRLGLFALLLAAFGWFVVLVREDRARIADALARVWRWPRRGGPCD